jgi:hypothetical protein
VGGLFVGIYAGMGAVWGAGALLGPSVAGLAMQATTHGLVYFVALAWGLFLVFTLFDRKRPEAANVDGWKRRTRPASREAAAFACV